MLLFVIHGFSANTPSIEDLFKAPQFTQPSLSMDGEFFVARFIENDQAFLMSYNLKNKKAVRMGVPKGCDIYDYDWVSNEAMIYDMSRDKQWVEVLGIVDRELKKPKTLVELKLVSVVDGLIHDPDHALLFFRNNPKNNIDAEELYRLNIKNGVYGKREKDFPGRVLGWYTDMYGEPRLVRVYRKGQEGKEDMYFREDADSKWTSIELSFPEGYSIHGFTPDGAGLYISAHTGKNTSSLSIYDLYSARISKEVFNDPKYDFDDASLHFFANPHFSSEVGLKGVSFQDQTVWFDEQIKKVQEAIDEKLVGTQNRIIDADTGLTRFLVSSYADILPAQYLLYDRQNDEIKLIAETKPWLNPEVLCQTQEVTFQTPDGLELSGYFTAPKNAKPPHPTVVLLHGGPHARDYWGFDPEVQFFATRGYAVLQVNYRGSTGFGKKISFEPRFEYLKMHGDVTAATQYAIRSGLIDSNCVAIVGASFGGYLAICGAALEPELYSCAVSNAGVFDWEAQWKHFKGYSNRRWYDELKQLIASKGIGEEYLKKASPIHHAKNIVIPVFIAGGKNDRQVPITQSKKLVRIMKKSGNKPVTYFKYGETHGFHFEKNRIAYYGKVLRFLDANIDRTKRKR